MHKINLLKILFPAFLTISFISGCTDYPDSPESPDNDAAAGPWEDVLAGDPDYPDNVYLKTAVAWEFGQAGEARYTLTPDYYDSERYPLDSTAEGACGPPEGCSAVLSSSEADMTVLGSGGWGIWKFDDDWVIVDGEGDDFVTFSNFNIWNGFADGSCNELAYVWVAESYDPDNPDDTVWYKSSLESFTVNSNPGTAAEGFDWSEVSGMHGRTNTWANFRDEIEAEELDSEEYYQYVTDSEGEQVYVSRYFSPDPDEPGYESFAWIGGDLFDLADFYTVNESNSSWPSGETKWPSAGKMRYIRFEDAPEAVDGQDWNPDWMTGSRIMAAMGINVEEAP